MIRHSFHRMADIRRVLAARSGAPSFLCLCAQLDRADECEHRPVRFLHGIAPHIHVSDGITWDWHAIALLLEADETSVALARCMEDRRWLDDGGLGAE